MVSASERTELIVFERATPTEDEHGGQSFVWATYATRRAQVLFGTAEEKRDAAQEGGVQSASFICERSADLASVTLKDRISYLGAFWDLTETAPLDRKTIRFTGTRVL